MQEKGIIIIVILEDPGEFDYKLKEYDRTYLELLINDKEKATEDGFKLNYFVFRALKPVCKTKIIFKNKEEGGGGMPVP